MTHLENTTLVKINASDRDALAKVCALNDLHVRFFTIEPNDNLLLAEICCAIPGMLFYLGRQVEIELEIRNTINLDLFQEVAKVAKP